MAGCCVTLYMNHFNAKERSYFFVLRQDTLCQGGNGNLVGTFFHYDGSVMPISLDLYFNVFLFNIQNLKFLHYLLR